MVDEKRLEAAFEAETAEVSPSPELWAKIRRETVGVPGRGERAGWLSRLRLGPKLEVLAACVLFAVLLGVAALRGVNAPPEPGGGPEPYISREAAIAAASKQVTDDALEVRDAVLLEQFQVEGKERPVWRVEFQTQELKQLVVTHFVDAQTGEIFWSENAPPSQGGTGGGQAGLQHYTPVRLALRDYRGAVRDLVANPDDAVAAGVRALGGPADYPSPPIAPTPGYELTLKGPDGQEVVLRYVGDGNWEGPPQWIEGQALAVAVAAALPVPEREPGDLEYLFGATELTVSSDLGIPAETWNYRRQVVVRVLRDVGEQRSAVHGPEGEPVRLIFTVRGQAETVEVWADVFRYGGRVYWAPQILQILGSNMSAG